jgi:lambda family phage tail tape measure protein
MATIKDRYELQVDTKGAQSSINGIRGALGALASVLAVREFVQFTKSITDATTQFERYQTVLTTFLGSQSKANAELARLRDLANSLPQDLADVTEAFVIFTRYGLDTSSQGIKNFSNIATASGKSLEQLAEALGDSLTGEYERLKEFGIKVSQENGKIVARMGEDIVAVAYNATELTNKLQELGNTRFGGAAEANAGTLSQSMSNLTGAVFEAKVAFGEGLKPALIEINNEMAKLLRGNQELIKSLGAGVGEALRTVAGAASFLAENIHLITTAITSFLIIKSIPFLIDIAKKFFAVGAAVDDLGGPLFRAKFALTTLVKEGLKFGGLTRIFAALTGPVGLAVTAITTLVAAVSALAPKTLELGNVTTTYGEAAAAVWWKVKDAAIEYATALATTVSTAFANFKNTLGDFAQPFIDAFDRMVERAKNRVNFIIGLFIGASQAIANVFSDESVDWVKVLNTDYLGNAVDTVSEAIGGMVDGVKESLGETVIAYREHKQAIEDVGKAYDDQILRQQRILESDEKIAAAKRKITEAIEAQQETQRKVNQAYDASLIKFNEEYDFRTSLIRLTDEQRELEEQRFAAQQSLAAAILPLQQQILELEKQGTEEARARIGVIQQSIGVMRDAYETELMYLDELVAKRNAELKLKLQSDSIDKARITAAESLLEIEQRISDAKESAGLNSLSGIAKDLKAIELAELKIARAAKARVRAQLESGVDATVIAAELAKIDALTQQSIIAQQDIAKTAYENSRMFSTGWKQAFEEYADNATNAAKQAERIFSKTTQGMEDSIVNFAKTGKFEWKGFVNSILEELLRSQVQQLIAKTFGALGGGGKSGGGGGLFGGFFATGGMIPPGRFGVVGENGPELVSGPANVTPNLGGGTVTYNINAVDAMSFKQMIAQDPQFLHAVSEQGRRSLPQTRR